MSRTASIINTLILIAGILMIIYYVLLGICVRFGQSLMILWPTVGALCVARYFFWKHAAAVGRLPSGILLTVLRVAVLALVTVFVVTECIICVGGMGRTTHGLDYIVVLGARVNPDGPSGALRNRCAAAAEYLKENPECKAVLSGGQGSDEPESEAACMYRLITEAGIDPDRLILEEKSTNTSENLRYSRALVPQGASVGIVTNNFHIFRARALARGLDWDVTAVPVATSAISWPHYMMREFVGLAHDLLLGRLG